MFVFILLVLIVLASGYIMSLDYATEKKLRPLYGKKNKKAFFFLNIKKSIFDLDALDEGQNKMALQHCAKLLKKSPDWPLVKVIEKKRKPSYIYRHFLLGFKSTCSCTYRKGRRSFTIM